MRHAIFSLIVCNGAQNNTFLDSSTNNFTITRNGNTTQGSFSPYGSLWSNYFGSGNRLALPNNSCVVGANDFTLEAWVNPSSFSAYSSIFNSQTNASTAAGSSYGIAINQTTGTLQSYWYVGSTTYDISSSSAVPLNQWSHVALVRTGGTVSLFLNGTKVATNTSMSTNSINDGATNFPPAIGYNGNGFAFLGYISNFRLLVGSGGYNATSSTITVPIAPLTAVTNTVVLSCQSNRFVDNSSNAFAITINGTPTVQRFSPFNPTAPYSTSVIGGSGYFDGSGDYLTAPASTGWVFVGDCTLEAWVYPTQTNVDSHISGTGTVNEQFGFSAGVGSGRVFWEYATFGGYLTTTANIPPYAWTHIAVSRTSGTVKAFVNGVQVFTGTSLSVNGSVNTNYIGQRSDGFNSWIGYMENTRIVNGTGVYTSAFTPPTAPLTAVTNTVLLLNYTNAGIPDLAMQNNLETVGNAQVSTSVKKYGTGSLAFDGTGDGLLAPSSPLYTLGTNPTFTIEGWIYLNAAQGSFTCIASTYADFNTTFANRWLLGVSSTTVRWWDSAGNFGASSSSLSTGQWIHVAVVGNGSTIVLYINGTSVATQSSNFAYTTQGSLKVGGGVPSMSDFNGYIDDLRITNGLARYTTNFTPPIAALPTF